MASLSDGNALIRASAVYGLSVLDADRPVQPVLKELAKADRRFAEEPLDAWTILESGLFRLRMIEAEATLVEALRASDPRLRGLAATALAELPGPLVVEALTAAVDDSHPDVRTEVVKALGTIGAESSRPALVRAAADPVRSVRRAANRALRTGRAQ